MNNTAALVGNPNSGKTTLFNTLTGDTQHVGNWPGVTVEKKTGKALDGRLEIVDLPGIYSLAAGSAEEKAARDFLLKEAPDVIINIVDGTNIERNLYLTLQLMELQRPLVLAVNMMDDVKARGGSIDCKALSRILGLPVIPISARKNLHVDQILPAAETLLAAGSIPPAVQYGEPIQSALSEIYALLYPILHKKSLPVLFYASALLEGSAKDEELPLSASRHAQIQTIAAACERQARFPDREALLADARYRFIERLTRKTVVKPAETGSPALSDRIDAVVTHRLLALPIFLAIMLGIFALTFGPAGTFLSERIEFLFNPGFSSLLAFLLDKAEAPQWTYALLIDAILSGVGTVLKFLPQIGILFLCLSLLEDSGYMARAAFITDRFLRRLGLSGKSFIPMLMGFGCTTPAVMAARTQENMRERRLTILLIPFMSCGAKLTIYALFAGTFFPRHKGLVVFSMYLLGFLMAVLAGIGLKKSLFRDSQAPFILELPPYRLPMPASVLRNTWEKCKGFIVKAGTVIFSMSVVIWLLQNLTPALHWAKDSSESIFGILGRWMAPAFTPLGFGDWRAGVSLLAGLVAKESVLSSLSILYGAPPSGLSEAIAGTFSPLSAYSYMVFCLLYVPCISAFATIRREMGGWRWALASAALQIFCAYTLSFLIYQIGIIIGRLF